jgi:hypothetical protein
MDQGQSEGSFDFYLPIRTIFFFAPRLICFAWQNLSHVDSAHPAKSKPGCHSVHCRFWASPKSTGLLPT